MRIRIGVVALLLASPSFAGERVGGALGIVNDYVFRGISQTYGRAAVQADIHYASPQGWSAGLWGSTIELNPSDGRTAELNAYAGYRWSLNRDWTAKASAVRYEYPWNTGRYRYDYNELQGSVGFRNNLFFTVAWSFDASRYSTLGYVPRGDAIAYEVATTLPLRHSFAVNAGIGYYDLHSLIGTGYVYWNAGLGYDRDAWHLDVNYIGTGSNAERLFYGDVAGKRVAASVLRRF